jgi:hypothetical protein
MDRIWGCFSAHWWAALSGEGEMDRIWGCFSAHWWAALSGEGEKVCIWGCFSAHWWAALHRKDVLVYFTTNCCLTKVVTLVKIFRQLTRRGDHDIITEIFFQ